MLEDDASFSELASLQTESMSGTCRGCELLLRTRSTSHWWRWFDVLRSDCRLAAAAEEWQAAGDLDIGTATAAVVQADLAAAIIHVVVDFIAMMSSSEQHAGVVRPITRAGGARK